MVLRDVRGSVHLEQRARDVVGQVRGEENDGAHGLFDLAHALHGQRLDHLVTVRLGHAEHCLAAIDAGKHVVCTKPMVADLDDAKRLVTRVRESGVKFLVGQTMRFDVQFVTMRRFVEDGDLGEIMVAEAHYNHDLRAIYEMTPWRLKDRKSVV